MSEREDKIMYMLGQMDGKLDGILERQAAANGRLGKHDEEITKLREEKSYRKGRGTLISTIVSAIVSVIVATIGVLLNRHQ